MGRDWNAGAVARVDGATALGLGSELGFLACWPLSALVGECLPGLDLGACVVAGSSSLLALESPSAV